MVLLEINGVDITKYISLDGYCDTEKTLVSNVKTNAKGDEMFDVVNRKYNIKVPIQPLMQSDVQIILQAVSTYICTIKFFSTKYNTVKTITGYIPDLGIEYNVFYTDRPYKKCKAFTLEIIEM